MNIKKIKTLNNQNRIHSERGTWVHETDGQDEFSIRFVSNGNEHFQMGNRSFTVYPDTFLTINSGTPFSRHLRSDAPVNSFSIFYTAKFLDSFHQTFSEKCRTLLTDPFHIADEPKALFFETLYPLSADMYYNLKHLKEAFDSEAADDILMSEYLYHFLFNFYRVHHAEIILKCERLQVLRNGTRTELFRRINMAKDYLISNYNQPISLEEVCRHCCLSEPYFFRTFRQAFDCTPHQFLIQFRLSQSKQLLRRTDYVLKDIVSEIGFECESSFIRLFKNRFGVTPVSYRKNMQAKQI